MARQLARRPADAWASVAVSEVIVWWLVAGVRAEGRLARPHSRLVMLLGRRYSHTSTAQRFRDGFGVG